MDKESMHSIEYKKLVMYHFKHFYENVDKGHGLVHVNAVCDLALEINDSLNLNLSEYDIILSAIAHDIYSHTSRRTHAEKGEAYILNDTGVIYDYVDDKVLVAKAVGEHRASYTGEHSSVLSELISAADRGEPNFNHILKRIYECTKDKKFKLENIKRDHILCNGKTLSDMGDYITTIYGLAIGKTFTHLVDKFSTQGYARYPDVYKVYFKDKLTELHNDIDKCITQPNILITTLMPD